MQRTVVTGIKPTGSPHLGNYVGAIKPALELMRTSRDTMYFVADYHALTTVKDPVLFNRLCYEVAATWLALGLDPQRALCYRQSDISEIFELSWILSCSAPKGLMNRAHAYKAAVALNTERNLPPDTDVNMGLYNYPILMAADILITQAEVVPVGKDQVQHVEMARDIAENFNRTYGEIFTLPEAQVDKDVGAIPGLDGRKMSKAYSNTIELFTSPQELRKRIFQIKTDSSAPEEPKDPDGSSIFHLFREFASAEATQALRERYLAGGMSWRDAKEELYETINAFLTEPREKYNDLMANAAQIDAILEAGAVRARERFRPLVARVRSAIGRTPYSTM